MSSIPIPESQPFTPYDHGYVKEAGHDRACQDAVFGRGTLPAFLISENSKTILIAVITSIILLLAPFAIPAPLQAQSCSLAQHVTLSQHLRFHGTVCDDGTGLQVTTDPTQTIDLPNGGTAQETQFHINFGPNSDTSLLPPLPTDKAPVVTVTQWTSPDGSSFTVNGSLNDMGDEKTTELTKANFDIVADERGMFWEYPSRSIYAYRTVTNNITLFFYELIVVNTDAKEAYALVMVYRLDSVDCNADPQTKFSRDLCRTQGRNAALEYGTNGLTILK